MAQTRNMKRPRELDEIPYKDIVFRKQIGEGEFGAIFKGVLWGQEVALKIIKDSHSRIGHNVRSEEAVRDFHHEAQIMRELRHPNIVEFLGLCCQRPKLCLVFEYMEGGTLERWSRENGGESVPIDQVISIALDIARGLNWMHHKGYIHRDLKPSNILFDSHKRAKIADFGLTQPLGLLAKSNTKTFLEGYWGQAGTAWYMAPEVLLNGKYGAKCDVYSLGMLLCEMLVGYHPFKDVEAVPKKGSTKLAAALSGGLTPTIPEHCPSDLADLIENCLALDPKDRPTADQVLESLNKISHTRKRDRRIHWKENEEDNDDEEEEEEEEENVKVEVEIPLRRKSSRQMQQTKASSNADEKGSESESEAEEMPAKRVLRRRPSRLQR